MSSCSRLDPKEFISFATFCEWIKCSPYLFGCTRILQGVIWWAWWMSNSRTKILHQPTRHCADWNMFGEIWTIYNHGITGYHVYILSIYAGWFNPYPLVIKHGVLEHGSVVNDFPKSPFSSGKQSSQVWWNQRVNMGKPPFPYGFPCFLWVFLWFNRQGRRQLVLSQAKPSSEDPRPRHKVQHHRGSLGRRSLVEGIGFQLSIVISWDFRVL